MKREDVEEIIACVNSERQIFYFYQDRYCLDLIQYEMTDKLQSKVNIDILKKSKFKQFVQKPLLKNILSQCGSGEIDVRYLHLYAPTKQIPFVITLDRWGDGNTWDQTSRNQSNLVLQINFDSDHDAIYKELIKPDKTELPPFVYGCHPINFVNRNTMAWVRLDIDFDHDEVLIEEIQNDWLRLSISELRHASYTKSRDSNFRLNQIMPVDGSYENLVKYVKEILLPYQSIWQEVCMTAAINFIKHTLGMNTIYYHTYETGRKLKAAGTPPKSVYTTLPKKFKFTKTSIAPKMLTNNKYAKRRLKAIKTNQWFVKII